MASTEIPSDKAPREHRPDSCLHCVLMTAIEKWFQRHGEWRNRQCVIDVVHVVSKLAECTVEITEMAGDRSQRRRAFRFAHEALDGCLKSQRTGKLESVEIPSEH